MTKQRVFLKLLVPLVLITIYSITLYNTITTSLELADEELTLVLPPVPFDPYETEALTRSGKMPLTPSVEFNPKLLRKWPGPQAISLDSPRLVTAAQATWLSPQDFVLGIEQNGEALALPLLQMAYHAIANLIVGGQPYLVMYCAYCPSAIGLDPFMGHHFTFDVYGLYNGALVLSDRQTGSIWSSMDGRVLDGALSNTGLELDFKPLIRSTWAEWFALYPQTLVLDQYPELAVHYQEAALAKVSLFSWLRRTIFSWDYGLPANELLLGAGLREEYRAYVLADYDPGLVVVNDVLGGVPVVLFMQGGAGFGAVYQSVVSGQILQFSSDGERIIDHTGTQWDVTGKAIQGPLVGSRLVYVPSYVTSTYSWLSYFPETGIYRP